MSGNQAREGHLGGYLTTTWLYFMVNLAEIEKVGKLQVLVRQQICKNY
jgi:hypothetical protein